MSLSQATGAETTTADCGDQRAWVKVAALEDLRRKQAMVVKVGAKQIALFSTEKGLYACNNRCPHEGYPLREGTITQGCVLTCNWHNWKFDLESGKTLVGGDPLRRYPVEIRGEEVWIDVADPPGETRREAALVSLRDSFRRMEYDRMAREIVRFEAAGGAAPEALARAIAWTHDRMEYGMTHAAAAAPDWLDLGRELARDEAERLTSVVEPVAHLAWDSLREPEYPFPEGAADYDPAALVQAIDAEDEAAALALLRGALESGMGFAELEGPLAEAALRHYADFGHSAIYVVKIGALIDRLGPAVSEPLLLALVRALVYAWREDLVPEFRSYADVLETWRAEPAPAVGPPPTPGDFRGLSAKQAMAGCLDHRGDPRALYDALLGAVAWNLLHFDRGVEQRTDNQVDDNVGWLSFTHAITFANAARTLAERHPDLWPPALLQIACFVGRNNAYVDGDQDVSPWRVAEPAAFFEETGRALFDHGQFDYLVAAHLVKTWMAARQEWQAAPDGPWADDLVAALNRFLNTPLKRKHVLRTARQSRRFVKLEG
jgi:nitrite reductase/ring-hydroxylating ferredoxin subunit